MIRPTSAVAYYCNNRYCRCCDSSNVTTVTIMQLKQMIMIQTRKQRRNLCWHILMNINYYHYANYKYDAAIIKYVMHIIIALLGYIWPNQQLEIDCMIYNYNICANRSIHEKIFGLVLGSITISIVACRDCWILTPEKAFLWQKHDKKRDNKLTIIINAF